MEEGNLSELLQKRTNNYFNAFDTNVNQIVDGIIFMYSSWSHSSVQFRNLVNSLEAFPEIKLYVFDIDNDNIENYKKQNDVFSDGWGETFWVKGGKIIKDMKKYNQIDLPSLIENNLKISKL